MEFVTIYYFFRKYDGKDNRDMVTYRCVIYSPLLRNVLLRSIIDFVYTMLIL